MGGSSTDLFDEAEFVGHEQHRRAISAPIRHRPERLAPELGVADGQQLVDQVDVARRNDRDGKAEPCSHPGRVLADRHVDRIADVGEPNDLVERSVGFPPGHSEEHRPGADVLDARHVGVHAGTQVEHGHHPALDRERPLVGFREAGDQAQERGLAGPVRSDHAQALMRSDGEAEISQRRDLAATTHARTARGARPAPRARRLDRR